MKPFYRARLEVEEGVFYIYRFTATRTPKVVTVGLAFNRGSYSNKYLNTLEKYNIDEEGVLKGDYESLVRQMYLNEPYLPPRLYRFLEERYSDYESNFYLGFLTASRKLAMLAKASADSGYNDSTKTVTVTEQGVTTFTPCYDKVVGINGKFMHYDFKLFSVTEERARNLKANGFVLIGLSNTHYVSGKEVCLGLDHHFYVKRQNIF